METAEHGTHLRTGHRRLDAVLAVSAILISVVSKLVAYHTSHSMEKLVQANSWPFLQLGHGNAFGESARIGDPSAAQIYFTILNAGTGPAVIHRFEFQYESRIIPADGGTIARFLTACRAGGIPGRARPGPARGQDRHDRLLLLGVR